MIYLSTLFFTWFITGITKFIVNCCIQKRLAFDLIGYGGMPSNHSAIVMSMAVLIGLQHGLNHPAFGAAVTLAFIVMLDANGLRNKMAQHATAINKINNTNSSDPHFLRERIGHSKIEILCGAIVGAGCAVIIHFVINFLAVR